jgi:nitrate/TMAO reductase-like tetraheme cytochrome c subunit
MKRSVVMMHVLILAVLTLVVVPTVVGAEETVCIQCHGGLEGRLSEPVGIWQSSVHAANGISCHDCHGGDPTDFAMAMSPERGFVGVPEYIEVPEFCGKCHLGVTEDYLASAHGQALEAGGAQCVVCHGAHEIQLANIELINQESCSRCHPYDRAQEIKQVISDTEANLARLETSVASLHRIGFDMQHLKDELFAQRNGFRQLFHTVSVEKINRQKTEFDKGLSATEEQILTYENEIGQRKLIGGGIVFLLVLGGCVALLIRKSYHEEE